MSITLFLILLKIADTLSFVPRIVGGRQCNIHDYPYLVQIRSVEVRGTTNHFFQGGGTILTPTIVLTAAHVVIVGAVKRVADTIMVTAGEQMWHAHDDMEKLGGPHRQMVNVNKHLIHDQFLTNNQQQLQFDIALLQVQPAFKFNDHVTAGKLPTRDYTKNCLMGRSMGWGATHEDHRMKRQAVGKPLKCVDLKIVTNEFCAPAYKTYSVELTSGQLCTWDPAQGSACQGDSGTPLVCVEGSRHVIIGIVSFGLDCFNATGVYMKVEFWKGWIETNMKKFQERSKAMARSKGGKSGGVSWRNGVIVNVIVMYALIINMGIN